MKRTRSKGATLVEYVLMLSFVTLLGLVSIMAFGKAISGLVMQVVDIWP